MHMNAPFQEMLVLWKVAKVAAGLDPWTVFQQAPGRVC